MNFKEKSILSKSGRIIRFLIVLAFFSSCNKDVNKYYNKIKYLNESDSKISISYPYNNTIFPPDIKAPTFVWNDTLFKCSDWNVFISDSTGNKVFSDRSENMFWNPGQQLWDSVKLKYIGKQLQFTLIGTKKGLFGKKFVYAKVNFAISNDSVVAPVFCRAVPLPFSYAVKNVNEIEWYIGNIGAKKPQKLLNNMPVCANCHSFPKDGSSLAMDVDYANDKGSYTISSIQNKLCIIKKDDIFTWSSYRKDDGENTFGLLSQISPNGRYVISTVKDRSVFVAIDNNFAYSQLFFPVKGILVYYDKQTKVFKELNGASDKNFVQSNPSWSPDGQEIIFARSSRYTNEKIMNSENVMLTISDAEEFVNGTKDFKFDLYKVDFNDGLGGEALPVEGASNNGKSNYFARYSPDGKWVVFCQAKSFMLLQSDSKLFIMPANGGTPRKLNCNMDQMNSWHSWSPNSKWIVFSSKNQGPYTQLYLTHIDENGNDSPPVLLEGFVFDEKAANIPEFYTGKIEDFTEIADNFSSSPIYFVNNASGFILDKDFLKAYKNIEKAIQLDPNYYEAYVLRMSLNNKLFQPGHLNYKNDYSSALNLINKQINKNTGDEQLLLNRAEIYMFNNEYEKAVAQAQKVLSINNKNFKAYEIVCYGLREMNEWEKTVDYYENWLANNPDNDKEINCQLAISYQKLNNWQQAKSLIDKMVNKYPSDPVMYVNRAFLLAGSGDITGALSDVNKAKDLAKDNYNVFIKIGELYTKLKKTNNAQTELNRAIEILNNKISEKPDDIELLFSRANVYKNMNNNQKALDDYYTILKYLPENYKALINAGQIEGIQQNWQNSLHCYETLIKYYRPEVDFYINLALINIQIKNLDKASEYFSEGVKIDPENTSLLYNRAMFYKTTKNIDSYLKELNKLSKIIESKKAKKIASISELKMFDYIQSELKK